MFFFCNSCPSVRAHKKILKSFKILKVNLETKDTNIFARFERDEFGLGRIKKKMKLKKKKCLIYYIVKNYKKQEMVLCFLLRNETRRE